MAFNFSEGRKDFPILQQKINGKPLIYFDNAATSQKPNSVIQAISNYYESLNSNIHRGAHYLANLATEEYENARKKIAKQLNAAHASEINFVRGTTEAVNLIAFSFGEKYIHEGDEILISEMEHHSNIVPWQMLCRRKNAILKVIPINEKGEIILEEYMKLLSSKTKLVSVVFISNSLGTVNPIEAMILEAKKWNAYFFVDAAQAVPHTPIDVQQLNCDFLAFSGHKVLGPTGIGILYGKKEIMQNLPPYMGGGEMIKTVSFQETIYNEIPFRFEAGTPHIAGAIGLAKAFEYLNAVGYENIKKQEEALLAFAETEIRKIENVKIVGTAKNKASVLSFNVGKIHPFDLGVLLDKQGIAVRAGNHCCQPLMSFFKIEGTCRASFAFYNSEEEIVSFIKALKVAIKMLS